MKILYVITKSNWGGAQRHVFDLAVAMKDRGHDVAVALGGDGLLRSKLEAAGIYTHSIVALGRDIAPGKDAGSFREIWSIIRHRKPDVLHLHSPKAAGLGAIAGRLARTPQILYTVHGWAFNESRPLHQRLGIIAASWVTMLLCSRVILLSEREYSQSLLFPGTKRRLSLVPLGIKPPVFVSIDGARQHIAKTIGMSISDLGKRPIVGTIAELHPNKGLHYLINAWTTVIHEHPQAILIIIGDGQDAASLSMLIKERGLQSSIFMTGYMEQASEYLKALSIFVLPSIKEGLPYVILEAGAASLPVVATTVGGIPEIVEDMRSGVLVQPHNVRELAHAISFMIEHPDERRSHGAALRERILTNFAIDTMIERVEALYKEVQ